MRVELGAPVVLVEGVAALWHIAAPSRAQAAGRGARRILFLDALAEGLPDGWPALCGLAGDVFLYRGSVRERRACGVCRGRAPRLLVAVERKRRHGRGRTGRRG